MPVSEGEVSGGGRCWSDSPGNGSTGQLQPDPHSGSLPLACMPIYLVLALTQVPVATPCCNPSLASVFVAVVQVCACCNGSFVCNKEQ